MHHDRVVGSIIIFFLPDTLIQMLRRKDLLAVGKKQMQKGLFRIGQFNDLPIPADFPSCLIEDDILIRNDALCRALL